MGELSRFGLILRRNLIRGLAVLLSLLWLVLATGCATSRPENVENICAIFEEKKSWYKAAKQSEKRWGTPTHVQMAIIHQESSFNFNARPPRTKMLGVIPWKRPSDAYGYAQALESTWDWYRKDTGRRSADRDDFDDAIDFVGWYTDKSQKAAGSSKWMSALPRNGFGRTAARFSTRGAPGLGTPLFDNTCSSFDGSPSLSWISIAVAR